MSHEAICPCNLQCNFFRKQYCRLQLGCQTYATCFATRNEIIFYARRVFKNVSGILIMSYCDWFLSKKWRDKLQWGCHTLQLVAQHCEKQKLLLLSLQLATQLFVARLVANMGCHTRKSSLQEQNKKTLFHEGKDVLTVKVI